MAFRTTRLLDHLGALAAVLAVHPDGAEAPMGPSATSMVSLLSRVTYLRKFETMIRT